VADLWPLIFVVPTAQQQDIARESLRDLLASTENATLPSAAEEASAGPMVRAMRLARAGKELLAAEPAEADAAEEKAAWRLKLEGVLREIDAGLAPEQRSEELEKMREAIGKKLTADPARRNG